MTMSPKNKSIVRQLRVIFLQACKKKEPFLFSVTAFRESTGEPAHNFSNLFVGPAIGIENYKNATRTDTRGESRFSPSLLQTIERYILEKDPSLESRVDVSSSTKKPANEKKTRPIASKVEANAIKSADDESFESKFLDSFDDRLRRFSEANEANAVRHLKAALDGLDEKIIERLASGTEYAEIGYFTPEENVAAFPKAALARLKTIIKKMSEKLEKSHGYSLTLDEANHLVVMTKIDRA